MITERTLKGWRRDALRIVSELHSISDKEMSGATIAFREQSQRILRLTQELLDLHLLRKEH